MGEGKAAQLAADRGILNEAISKAANVYGVIQDLPFRRSAFLHEARREGFKTVKDVERLLMDESQRDVLFRIADRANSAIIDYSRLGRFERSVLRRVLYFYPWLKGATVYSAYALGEHPLQAMTAGVLGQQAQAQSDATFGDLPSWAHGLFKVGERNGMPVTINPSNILPFTTGADIAQTLSGMIAGKTPSAQNLEGNLSPAAAAFLSALTGRSSLGAQLPQRGFAEQFGRSLVENTPVAALVKRLTTDQSGKSYPTSTTEAILQYILGPAVSGRTTNVGVLNSLAAKEQSGR
jgi:hypothetical protein